MPDLDFYRNRLAKLTLYRGKDGPAPHKPCLLLAVLDLVEYGAIAVNRRVEYVQILETGFFSTYFSLATGIEPGSPEWRRKYRPFDPFWHLKNEAPQFWRLCPRPGREEEFGGMRRSGGKTHSGVLLNVAYAELDGDLFALMQDPVSRAVLRQTILDKYFSEGPRAAELREVAGATLDRRVEQLRRIKQRDPRFRENVIRAYQGKCAATGEKIVIPGGAPELVEAAHLIPFCISYNNDTCNGMALQPTYHRAMDKLLIAPGPDEKWHVAPALLESALDNCLRELEGKPVLLPENERSRPWEEGLRWRMENLQI